MELKTQYEILRDVADYTDPLYPKFRTTASEASQNIKVLSGQATLVGDTTIVTPASGKKIRLLKLYAQNINATATVIYFKIVIATVTVNVLPATLIQYQIVSDNVKAGQKYIECDVNAVIKVNLGVASNVNWMCEWLEV